MRIVLGFDGGGTKTECAAMDLSGAVVARGRGPASNPTRIGFEPAAEGVKQAALLTVASLEHPVEIAAICAGLAGTGKPENHERMRRLLEEKFPGLPLDLRTDLDLSLAAMPEGPAIVLVVGTGSAAVGRDASGEQLREGGYGRFGSDEGSAFDIGRAATLAVRESHENKAADALAHLILRHLGSANWQQVDAKSASSPDEVFPRVFPVIAAAADASNPLAQSLLSEAAKKLASLALRLAQRLSLAQQPFSLGKTGGTIGRSQFFDRTLDRELHSALPLAAISHLTAHPAETAAGIALRNVGARNEALR